MSSPFGAVFSFLLMTSPQLKTVRPILRAVYPHNFSTFSPHYLAGFPNGQALMKISVPVGVFSRDP